MLSSDDSEVVVTPQDYKVTLLCNSNNSRTLVGSVQLSSEEDHPLSSGQDDRRKVRKRNNRPLCRSDSMDRLANEPAKVETLVDMGNDSLMNRQPMDELPECSNSELRPLIYLKDTSVVDMMDMTGCPLPRCSEVAVALRLHHDASLIMTNVQVMAQFITGLKLDGIGSDASGVQKRNRSRPKRCSS